MRRLTFIHLYPRKKMQGKIKTYRIQRLCEMHVLNTTSGFFSLNHAHVAHGMSNTYAIYANIWRSCKCLHCCNCNFLHNRCAGWVACRPLSDIIYMFKKPSCFFLVIWPETSTRPILIIIIFNESNYFIDVPVLAIFKNNPFFFYFNFLFKSCFMNLLQNSGNKVTFIFE